MASNDGGEERRGRRRRKREEKEAGRGEENQVMDIFIFKIDIDFKSMQFL
jgi:hypothetical protein